MHALIVFAEHRYFGGSIPEIDGIEHCLSYLSSQEALADYASVVRRIRSEWGGDKSAVIAFGGSYGGMLSSWMRIMYPHAVDGGKVYHNSFTTVIRMMITTVCPFVTILSHSNIFFSSGVGVPLERLHY